MHNFPYLGFGLGLRPKHYETILNSNPSIDWFEIITEDYLVAGGHHLSFLDAISERYPLVMHGVSLSIGGCDPLDKDYLNHIKQLANRLNPAWISDHLCWTGVNGINAHDLLPLPYTQEALEHIVTRVKQVQDYLERYILLENVSSYVTFKDSEMTEWEFLNRIAEQADCMLLLDVNNIYVSAFNHGFDPLTYLNAIDPKRVCQFHIAGHSHCGTHIVDTHDHNIINDVWGLYEKALQRFPNASTLIERDDHIPPLEDLLIELNQARTIAEKVTQVKL